MLARNFKVGTLLQQSFLVSLDPCNVLFPLNNLFLLSFQNVVDVLFFSRELLPSDSIATDWVIIIASECVDTFPFWEDISTSKLSITVCTTEGDVSDIPCILIFSVAATAADLLQQIS